MARNLEANLRLCVQSFQKYPSLYQFFSMMNGILKKASQESVGSLVYKSKHV
jgi:hypothetical protein